MSTVKQRVRKLEKQIDEQPFWQEEKLRMPIIVLGSVIYAIGVNLFLRPLHLYSGGFMGFAQLITTMITICDAVSRLFVADPMPRYYTSSTTIL